VEPSSRHSPTSGYVLTGDQIKGGQYPFFVASSLCLFSACIVWFLPKIDQDTIELEDKRFRQYLVDNGWDISQMGSEEWQSKRRTSLAAAEQKDS